MKEPFIAKYYEDKLVRLYSLEDVDSFAVCDTKIQIIKNNGHTYTMEFDTYENAIIGLELIKSKMEEKFEEEFEDEIKLFLGMNGIEFVNKSIESIFSKYIGKLPTCGGSNRYKVKIKAKDGKIVIERIK